MNMHDLAEKRTFPAKKYCTIVADPPWSAQQKGARGAQAHYDLMADEEIARLPIPDLLEDDAHLWLWCFNASRIAAQEIAENAWGLTFRSELIWDKRNYGLGQYLRGSHEHLLLFSRGRAPILARNQRDVADWPRAAQHSRKPEEAMVMIQRLSPGPFLEMFSRRRFPGFDHWGLEVPGGSDVFIPGFPVPEYSGRAWNPVPGDPIWADGVIRGGAEVRRVMRIIDPLGKRAAALTEGQTLYPADPTGKTREAGS